MVVHPGWPPEMGGDSMRRWVVAITSLAVLLVALGAFLFVAQDPPEATFPTRATGTYPDGSSAVTFKSIGEFVATAAFVVEGEVLDVERGDPVRLADGSEADIVPRLLDVEVRKLLYSRDPQAGAPETLLVTDGYWEDGVGHERESIGWVKPGQVGFFVVSRDRAPDGTLMSTYSPLNGYGIALLDGERVEYAHQGVWQPLGHSATAVEFREALSGGISAAQSGAAEPVTVTICYPSVPGDEESEPVCFEE